MAESKQFSCRTCGRIFSRMEHLRRHDRSHNDLRPYKCKQCGKSYGRCDVLKRHRQSCKDSLLYRGSSHTAKTHGSSRHLFSKFRISEKVDPPSDPPAPQDQEDVSSTIEDQLAALNSPRWETAGQLVSYQTPTRLSAKCRDLDPEMFFLGLCGTNEMDAFVTQNPVTSFSFLVRFTAGLGLKAAYEDPVSSIEELFDLDAPHNDFTESDAGSLDFPIQSLSSDSAQVSDRESSQVSLSGCKTAHVGCMSYATAIALLPSYLDVNSVIGKCLGLVADLKQACCTFMPAHVSSATNIDAVAAQFFSPARLLCFLDYYWSEWHPNLPFIHRPLFVTSSAPAPLLAAMAVIGACYSPCTRDQQQRKLLYDVVEQLVFNQLSTVASHSPRNRRSQRQLVQTLQAACIVVIFQSKDGEVANRYRCRRQRMSQMIEAMRLLGVSRARHYDYRNTNADEFNWQEYSEREELIRVCNWCFTVDAAFVTFYNLAPRLSLRELKMGLQSPEPCFEAISAQTCHFELQKWQYQTDFDHETSLYTCLVLFCRAELDFATQIRFAHQSSFTLFCITSASLVMLFNMDPEIGPLSQYEPLMTAINNWRVTWNRHNILAGEAPPSGLMQLGKFKQGYWKHCAEYWLLAYISVQQIVNTRTVSSHPLSDTLVLRPRCFEYDELSQSRLHNFIQAYSCGMVVV